MPSRNQICLRLVLFILFIGVSCVNALAIEPPVITYPLDGDTNVTYGSVYMRFNFTKTSGLYIEVETDTVITFDSDGHIKRTFSNPDFSYYRPDELLSQWYYIRARLFNVSTKDTSEWMVTTYRTLRTFQVSVPDTVVVNEFPFTVSPTSNDYVRFIFDTTKSFDSPLYVNYGIRYNSAGNIEANADSTTYYYKVQTITRHDTSEFSPIDSFFTDLRVGMTQGGGGCSNDGIVYGHFTFTTPYKGWGNGTFRMECSYDSSMSNIFFDSIVPYKPSLRFQGCNPIYLRLSAIKDSFSSSRNFKVDLCTGNVEINPFLRNNKFQFKYTPCIEMFEVEFDSTASFNSADKFTFNWQPPDTSYYADIDIDFPVDPINYYWRYRTITPESVSDWSNMGRLVRSYIRIEDNGVLSFKISSPRIDKYNHRYQICVDTVEDFSSNKLRVLQNDSTNGYIYNSATWNLAGHLFASKNYIKFQTVSPNGQSEPAYLFTSIKPITIQTEGVEFNYPYYVPYSGASVFEFSTSKNFDADFIGEYIPSSPGPNILSTLLPDRTYWFRYKGVNALDTTPWLDTLPYKTINTRALLNPIKQYPKDWSDVKLSNNNAQQFTWEILPSDHAQLYQFRLFKDTVDRFSLFYTQQMEIGQSSLIVRNLDQNANYFWTIESKTSQTGLSKNPGTYWTFSTYGTSSVPSIQSSTFAYPNPSYGSVYLQGIDYNTIESLSLINISGQRWPIQFDHESHAIDISDFNTGTYFLEIQFVNGSSSFSKIHLIQDK